MNQQNPSWINKGTGDTVFLGIRSTLQASALQQRVERIQEAFEAGSGCWPSGKKNNGCLILLMAEIRQAPVEVGSFSTIIYRVSAPSQVVVWDFSHQQ